MPLFFMITNASSIVSVSLLTLSSCVVANCRHCYLSASLNGLRLQDETETTISVSNHLLES